MLLQGGGNIKHIDRRVESCLVHRQGRGGSDGLLPKRDGRLVGVMMDGSRTMVHGLLPLSESLAQGECSTKASEDQPQLPIQPEVIPRDAPSTDEDQSDPDDRHGEGVGFACGVVSTDVGGRAERDEVTCNHREDDGGDGPEDGGGVRPGSLEPVAGDDRDLDVARVGDDFVAYMRWGGTEHQ